MSGSGAASVASVASGASLLALGFDGLVPSREILDFIAAGGRAVVLFARNYDSPAQLARLCQSLHQAVPANSSDPDLLIAVDHEGGRVQRFRNGFTAIPAMRTLGAAAVQGDLETSLRAVEGAARTMASELRAAGIDLDFAPVVDVDSNPGNPVIGERSLGPDAALVATLASRFIATLQAGGVAACAKHFPGHGDTSVDSHLALPTLGHDRARLESLEWVPFRAAIAAGVASIMTAHVVLDSIDPGVPGTLSEKVVTGVLRGELGFDGLVFSDDLEMKAVADTVGVGPAAVGAIRAGCDLAIVSNTERLRREALAAVEAAVASGAIASERIAESRRRRTAALRRVSVAR